jgi:hypothetical protein
MTKQAISTIPRPKRQIITISNIFFTSLFFYGITQFADKIKRELPPIFLVFWLVSILSIIWVLRIIYNMDTNYE